MSTVPKLYSSRGQAVAFAQASAVPPCLIDRATYCAARPFTTTEPYYTERWGEEFYHHVFGTSWGTAAVMFRVDAVRTLPAASKHTRHPPAPRPARHTSVSPTPSRRPTATPPTAHLSTGGAAVSCGAI